MPTLRGIVFAALLAWVNSCFGQSVILISIDTLRADHLSLYGYRKLQTPNLDAYASGGMVFDAIDSQIPLTLPSHTVLFTSTYPFANRVEENDQVAPKGAVTLASVLRSHGYKTAAFVGSVLMDRSRGLDQGFDVYDSPFSKDARRDGALVLRAARQWLEENRNRPVFAFIHLFDLHAPYSRAASDEGLPNSAGYDVEIAYVDRLLGQFRQALMQGGWWDRSIVVVLADHGESLGEHGELSHGYFVYQSTLRVPLILHWPQGQGARISQPGGLIDVSPTILELLKIPAPASFRGTSLLGGAARPVYGESLYPRDAFGWAALRSIREGQFQYIDAPKPELYDLRIDPKELHNAFGENRQMAARLMGMRGAYSIPVASAPARTSRALESLGYVGRGSPGAATGADPKDRLAEYNLFEKALAAMYSSHLAAAIAEFGQLLSRDAHNSLARYYRAEAYQRAGQGESAVREWNTVLKFDPQYVPAAEALGAWWSAHGKFEEARAAFEKAVAVAPGDYAALEGLAMAEEHLGLKTEAARDFDRACKVAPGSAACGRTK